MTLTPAARASLRRSPYLERSVVPGPVGLVIVPTPGGANALTVSLFSEVAHFPTTMWVAIAPHTYTHSLLLEAGRFSFITLHRKQAVLAAACGTASGRETPKCRALELYQHGDGFLFLEDALASTACVIERSHPVGDHTLFIGRMLSGELTSRRTAERQLLLSDLRAL